MSLEYSISAIMNRLSDWSRFPKYQLERRIDIFLTPFLEAFVSERMRAPARLIAPEFPILSELAGKQHDVAASELSARTVNVDYLLRIDGEKPRWLFLELKTDAFSFKSSQAELYAIARQRGMPKLIADLDYVQGKTQERHEAKYGRLIGALQNEAPSDAPIVVAYLAPPPCRGAPPPVGPGALIDEFFPLEEFAGQDVSRIPPEHRDLWFHVRDLLRAVQQHASR